MPTKRTSNDLDHILSDPPAEPPKKSAKRARTPPPEPWPMPRFQPMKITNPLTYGRPRNLGGRTSAYEVFSLFFDEETLQELANNTNEYARLNPGATKPHSRAWEPVSIEELRAYIATYIWMGLHKESGVVDYWKTDETVPLHTQVRKHISSKRWQQIDRFFHISPPTSPDSHTKNTETVFQKLEPLSENLRKKFKRYWQPGTHLTVDEAIQRFMGRAKEIVNIPSKPVPEGFKIWVLANAGYILDWMWHAKGDENGPVDLDDFWTKDLGFSKTQAVVLDLIKQTGISDKKKHVIWLDNLFTSARLLTQMKEEGFGGAGTVRLSQTRREILEISHGTKAQKQRISKEINRGLDGSLSDLKLKHNFQLQWGKLFGRLSDDNQVLQFAWKDNNVVLFMSTVARPENSVIRARRRPAATSTNAKTSWAAFGEETVKDLAIPEFIDLYNHFMNGVDTADQLRSYYGTQRVHVKHWKALWHYLLDTTITNAYKLTHCTAEKPYGYDSKHSSHKRFRIALANELYAHSRRLHDIPTSRITIAPRRLADLVKAVPAHLHEGIEVDRKETAYCVACRGAGRVATSYLKRKPLNELQNNSMRGGGRRQRGPRTQHQCGVCRIALCDHIQCWNEHIDAVNAICRQ